MRAPLLRAIFGALAILTAAFPALGQPANDRRRSTPQPDDEFPPLFLTLPLGDAFASATLGASRRPADRDIRILRETFGANKLKYTDAQVKDLLSSQIDLEKATNKKKIGLNLGQFGTAGIIDTGVGALNRRYPAAAIVTGFFADLSKRGLEAYYSAKRAQLDNILVLSLQRHLDILPRASSITAGEIKRYYLTRGDALLGSPLLGQLKAAGASPEVLQAIIIDEVDRLIAIVASGGKTGSKPVPDKTVIHAKNLNPGVAPNGTEKELAKVLLAQGNMRRQLAIVAKAQNKMRISLETLKNGEDKSHANEVYKILLSQQPASKQRQIFNDELNQRRPTTDEEKILEALAARELFEETLPEFAKQVDDVGTIALNAGLPRDVRKSIASVSRATNTIADVGRAALGGNPLGVFAGLTSLLTGGSPDADAKAFGVIIDELNSIRKTQTAILQLLTDVALSISGLAEQLEKIDVNIGAVALMARESREEFAGLGDCQTLNSVRLIPNSTYTLPDGRFKSFAARQAHYKRYPELYTRCLGGLRKLFIEPAKLSQLFQQDFATDTSGKPVTFLLAEQYRHVWSLLNSYVPLLRDAKESEREAILDRLFVASLDPTALNKLPELIKRLSSGDTDTSSFLPTAKAAYLSVRAIDKYVRSLIDYYPYFIYLGDSKGVRDVKTLMRSRDEPAERDRVALASALIVGAMRLVNTAIAQQELLSASLTTIAVDESLLSWQWPDSKICRSSNLTAGAANDAEQKRIIQEAEAQTEKQFLIDNGRTLRLLAGKKALRENWIRVLAMRALAGPEFAVQQKAFDANWPQVTFAQKAKYFVDIRLAREQKARNTRPESYIGASCAFVMLNAWFPDRMTTTPMTSSGTLKLKYGDGGSAVVDVDFPVKTVPDNDDLNEPQYGPEMYVLRDLRQQLSVALLQIHGFENLSDPQRKLAAFLLLRNQQQ